MIIFDKIVISQGWEVEIEPKFYPTLLHMPNVWRNK
jgi:hypothetical protein